MAANEKTEQQSTPETRDPEATGISHVGDGDEFPESKPEAPKEPEAPEAPKDPGTLSGSELRDAAGEGNGGPTEPLNAVEAAATGAPLTPVAQQDALQWFMKAEPDRAEEERKTLKLNFGTTDEPEWVEWKIKPIQLDVLRRIRQEAANSRHAKQTGQIDEYRVNLAVVVAGTINPDINEAARLLHERGAMPSNDPSTALRLRFQNKPGYIVRVAGEIMSLSGFNDEDVTDTKQVDAAGNS